MRPLALCSLLATIPTILAEPEYSPFSNPAANPIRNPLLKVRQNTCEPGENICTALGSNACCASGLNCQFDFASNVACCPSNVVCTGTIGVTSPATITSNPTTSSVVLGGSTTASTTPIAGFGGGGSTVPNPYYPFIYIPTAFQNAEACSAAWSGCQSESTSCLVALATQNGVTVNGFGYGITVTGSSGTVLSAASSICSTLSTSACYNLQTQQCAQYGGIGAAARPTACPGMVYAAGAVAGAVGALI